MSLSGDGRGVAGLVHQALIYDSDEDLVSPLSRFCAEGLDCGDRVLAVLRTANIGLLRDSLGAAAADVEFVDSADWYDAPGRVLGAYGRYVAGHGAGGSRVRIVGELVWSSRTPVEEAEWARYESVLNAAFADRPASIICPYDQRALPEHVVAHARRTHPEVLAGDGLRPSRSYTDPAAFACDGDELPLPAAPAASAEVIDVEFDSDLPALRGRAAAHATVLGMSATQIERLVMAVNELATNTLQHGGGRGRLRIWPADGDTVVCDVTDAGLLDAAFPGYLPPDSVASAGLGLWVVRQLCDFIQIRADRLGTQIRLHLARA